MLCLRVGILLMCGKHSHNRLISLRGEIWAKKACLTTPPFYWSTCTKLGKRVVMYLSVRGIDFASFLFLNCSDGVVFIVFHFIDTNQQHMDSRIKKR